MKIEDFEYNDQTLNSQIPPMDIYELKTTFKQERERMNPNRPDEDDDMDWYPAINKGFYKARN